MAVFTEAPSMARTLVIQARATYVSIPEILQETIMLALKALPVATTPSLLTPQAITF